MEQLVIYVCENFRGEYQRVVEEEGFEDVTVKGFPALCHCSSQSCEMETFLQETTAGRHSVVFGSRYCQALQAVADEPSGSFITGDHCFSPLVCDEFLNHLVNQGDYFVSGGWLCQWQENLAALGFDRATAARFFQESSQRIVLFDSGIHSDVEVLLKDFSSYVGLPCLVIPVKLDGLRYMLRSCVYEWRLAQQGRSHEQTVHELRSQSAEYSATFDMMGKLSAYAQKRDVIQKIKDLFMMVFGAQNFHFWSDQVKLPNELLSVKLPDEQGYRLFKGENRFCISIHWEDRFYGIIDVSDFLFPQYIEKYLNLAIEVSKFCGLVLHNAEQYETVLASEEKMKYLSYHDSMVGLYNRTYMNRLLSEQAPSADTVVFMFDLDGLKGVNDRYGHAEGDGLLVSFAEILRRSFRETDVVARIGGDEFAAVLYDTDTTMAESIKQRLLDMIAEHNQALLKKHLQIGVSMGYAVKVRDTDTIEEIMKRADALMYADKAGKHRQGSR